jgi:excisionase family DNA binding protein
VQWEGYTRPSFFRRCTPLGQLSPLLTVQQCAELLAVSRPTIYRLVRDHGLPVVRPTGNDIRFRPDDLESWLESRSERVGA